MELPKEYELKDVFNEYSQYIKNTEVYRPSSFSRNLTKRLKNYHIDNILKYIKKNAKPYTSHFAINETEKDILSLFMSCTTIKQSKSHFPDKKVISPFPRFGKNENSNEGLTDLYEYIKYLKNHIEKNPNKYMRVLKTKVNIDELNNIIYKIELSLKLKNSLERLIYAVYFQNKFNTVIFELMLARLDGFIDELNILNASDDEYGLDNEYNSADVSIAASLVDVVADRKFPAGKIPKKDIIKILENATAQRQDKNFINLLSNHQYVPLSNITTKLYKSTIKSNYRDYLDDLIENMVKDYFEIYKTENIVLEMESKFLKKYGIDINPINLNYYRLETVLYENFLQSRLDKIISKTITPEKLIKDIKEEIHNILLAAENDTKEIIKKDEYQIFSVLDKLLFKPFIHLHDLDIEKLKKRNEKSKL